MDKTMFAPTIRKAPGQVMQIFERFTHSEAVGSILLLIATLIALVCANSPWANEYFAMQRADLGIAVGNVVYTLPFQQIINDGLMALFFLVVGLEIKREILVGELSATSKAILPVAAALGGMVLPAMIYLLLNVGQSGAPGWGIPMATDIAFTLGILALLGSRVPTGLKVFLTALAIADDLGAVMVIALFYSSALNLGALLIAFVLLGLISLASNAHIRRQEVYVLLAVGVWSMIFLSGIHATIAGVLLALTIPVRVRVDPDQVIRTGQVKISELERQALGKDSVIRDRNQMETINELYEMTRTLRPVGLTLEEYLHPILIWFVLPLFALFNAGIHFDTQFFASLAQPVTLGVILGLVAGKQTGVTLLTWLTARSGRAQLPSGVDWKQIYAVSWLCGMGFTMSLFITELAFQQEALSNLAKAGILTASLIAGIVGFILLFLWLPKHNGANDS